MLNSHDQAKEFVSRIDEEVNWLMEMICTSKHPICSAPMDIAMKRDGKGDGNAALSLQAFEICNALSQHLDLDGKCPNSRDDIKRIIENVISGEAWVKFPDR